MPLDFLTKVHLRACGPIKLSCAAFWAVALQFHTLLLNLLGYIGFGFYELNNREDPDSEWFFRP